MPNKISFTLNFDQKISQKLEDHYGRPMQEEIDYCITAQTLDARGAQRGRRPQVHYEIELLFSTSLSPNVPSHVEVKNTGPVVIVGAGPAGLFCALYLLEYGVQSVIVERGAKASERMKDISQFWRKGILNPESNVCFGEGGAGLFSDGKLITRIKSPWVSYVLKKLVDFGAPAHTAYRTNPHLGSNKIRGLIGKITAHLQDHGCQILTKTKFESFDRCDGKISQVHLSQNHGTTHLVKECAHLVLATGHSAHDVYHYLEKESITMKAKDFAVGVRIEHPRLYLDQCSYGDFAGEDLGAAFYKLSHHNHLSGRGTYSFCMCPGGHVLSSGTEKDGHVTNGMSNMARNAPWSNSALVVSVLAEKDFAKDAAKDAVPSPMAGLQFQKDLEQKSFQAAGRGKAMAAMNAADFVSGKKLFTKLAPSSCPSGLVPVNMDEVFPDFITAHLREGLEAFQRKIPGFLTSKAQLIAPETRTSAPLTVLRDGVKFQSPDLQGLYPCGEGAGHAGGITSAAVDGVKVARAILFPNF